MPTAAIVTLTINPSLDKSTHFDKLVPEQKLRCTAPHYDAGGGGINVSKAIARLGGESLAIFTSGGPIGKALEHLVAQEKIQTVTIPTKSWTRENFIALDTNDNAQYRFGFPGPKLSAAEIRKATRAVVQAKPQFLVLSGSLNEGLDPDFYALLSKKAKAKGVKVVVDTSGDALDKTLKEGVYLAKPNLGELAKLIGVERIKNDEIEAAAQKLIAKGYAQLLVVSMGPAGAVLVSKEETHYVKAPNVPKKSTVGAGDSMVGGIVWALSQDKSLKEALQWGVACGSAATMNEGTLLFKAQDAKRLFKAIQKNQ